MVRMMNGQLLGGAVLAFASATSTTQQVMVPQGGVPAAAAPHQAAWWGGPQWGLRNTALPAREQMDKSRTYFRREAEKARADVFIETRAKGNRAAEKFPPRRTGTRKPLVAHDLRLW